MYAYAWFMIEFFCGLVVVGEINKGGNLIEIIIKFVILSIIAVFVGCALKQIVENFTKSDKED